MDGSKSTNGSEGTSNVLAPMRFEAKTPVPNRRIEISSGPQLVSIFEVVENVSQVIGE